MITQYMRYEPLLDATSPWRMTCDVRSQVHKAVATYESPRRNRFRKPSNAHHITSIINSAWIDAKHALFDLATLPAGSISRDLFGERMLVERKTFIDTQTTALPGRLDGSLTPLLPRVGAISKVIVVAIFGMILTPATFVITGCSTTRNTEASRINIDISKGLIPGYHLISIGPPESGPPISRYPYKESPGEFMRNGASLDR